MWRTQSKYGANAKEKQRTFSVLGMSTIITIHSSLAHLFAFRVTKCHNQIQTGEQEAFDE